MLRQCRVNEARRGGHRPGRRVPTALILRALAEGALHGYAIARRIEDATGEVFRIRAGSLYLTLCRMEKHGRLEVQWWRSELRHRAKLYQLTAKGRRQPEEETRDWLRFQAAVTRVLLST